MLSHPVRGRGKHGEETIRLTGSRNLLNASRQGARDRLLVDFRSVYGIPVAPEGQQATVQLKGEILLDSKGNSPDAEPQIAPSETVGAESPVGAAAQAKKNARPSDSECWFGRAVKIKTSIYRQTIVADAQPAARGPALQRQTDGTIPIGQRVTDRPAEREHSVERDLKPGTKSSHHEMRTGVKVQVETYHRERGIN